VKISRYELQNAFCLCLGHMLFCCYGKDSVVVWTAVELTLFRQLACSNLCARCWLCRHKLDTRHMAIGCFYCRNRLKGWRSPMLDDNSWTIAVMMGNLLNSTMNSRKYTLKEIGNIVKPFSIGESSDLQVIQIPESSFPIQQWRVGYNYGGLYW